MADFAYFPLKCMGETPSGGAASPHLRLHNRSLIRLKLVIGKCVSLRLQNNVFRNLAYLVRPSMIEEPQKVKEIWWRWWRRSASSRSYGMQAHGTWPYSSPWTYLEGPRRWIWWRLASFSESEFGVRSSHRFLFPADLTDNVVHNTNTYMLSRKGKKIWQCLTMKLIPRHWFMGVNSLDDRFPVMSYSGSWTAVL